MTDHADDTSPQVTTSTAPPAPAGGDEFSPDRLAATLVEELAGLAAKKDAYTQAQAQLEALQQAVTDTQKEYSAAIKTVLGRGLVGAEMLTRAGFVDPAPARRPKTPGRSRSRKHMPSVAVGS